MPCMICARIKCPGYDLSSIYSLWSSFNQTATGPNGGICRYSAGFKRAKEVGQEERGCVGAAAPKWCVNSNIA